MAKPKVIFFDIGNVLVKLRTEAFLERMVEVSDPRWTKAAVLEAIREPIGPHVDYEKGLLDGEAFYRHIRERFGLSLDHQAWLKVWNDYFEPNRPMETLVARLRGQARFFALSNTNAEHLATMKRNFRVMDAMEGVVASNEVGERKPDEAMFTIALKKAGVTAEEALYIDDIGRFTDIARGLGWQVFNYTYNDDELRQALLAMGFSLAPLDGRSVAAC